MKKTGRKAFSLLLAVAMVLSMLPINVFAVENENQGALPDSQNAGNQWVKGADLPSWELLPRVNEVVELGGKLYSTNLFYDFGEPTFSIYDPETDSWTLSAVSPTSAANAAYTVFIPYGSKIYCFGRSYDIYDTVTDTWSEGGLISDDHYAENTKLRGVLYDGKIYLFHWFTYDSGGCGFAHIYDIETGTMIQEGKMPAAGGVISEPVIYQNKIYMAAEYHPMDNRRILVYDLETGEFSHCGEGTASNKPGGKAVLHGDKIYYLGVGQFGGNSAVYDITTDSWSSFDPEYDFAYNDIGTYSNSKIYMVNSNEFRIFDLETEQWSEGPSLNLCKSNYGDDLIVSNGRLYAVHSRNPIEWYVIPPKENPKDIVSLETERKSIKQNIELWPTEKENEFGTPSTAELPETVEATLRDGSSVQVPVTWQVEGYDPAAVGKQSFTGELVLVEDSGIENPDNLQAELEITVTAAEYEVWDASPLEITVEVLPGTTVAELNEKLKAEGKTELSVDAVDMSTEDHVYTFCDIEVKEGNNAQWASQMDVPGEYRLTASLPENFTPLDVDIPGPVEIKVTVTEPLEIISVEPVNMEAYQSVSPGNLENVPKQVMATLEGGIEIPIDVLWNWEGSGYQKNAVGSQIVSGELVNLPSRAKQPEQELPGTLNVDVQAVSYEVKSVSSDNLFEADAGLTLEEITQIAAPKLTLEITSVTEGITLTTEYEAEVSLEEEKNPEYNAKAADVYILEGTLTLPENITCAEGQALEEIILQTNPVEVTSIEPVNVLVPEGTPFAEIELPGTVLATLSSKGIDGENKKERLEVDWGAGEGYTPYPSELTDDNTVTMEVTSGELVNCQAYVNTAGVVAPLNVTVAREFEIEAISPSRYPETGEMEVKLGSGLEEISNGLDSHNVQVTLKSTKGETSTVEMSFELREEENPSYDPMELGTYTLKAYLPLEGNIRNPKGLGVEIVVKTKKYTIATTKAVRVTGVESGTKFEDVPMPELAPITRNDGEVEEIPVSWDGSRYNPTKIGSQVVKGTLVTPLPVHLENPNNRQPSAVVTVVNPEVKVVSLEPMKEVAKAQLRSRAVEEGVPGYTEYKYRAELLHKDGSTTYEVISVFVENK